MNDYSVVTMSSDGVIYPNLANVAVVTKQETRVAKYNIRSCVDTPQFLGQPFSTN